MSDLDSFAAPWMRALAMRADSQPSGQSRLDDALAVGRTRVGARPRMLRRLRLSDRECEVVLAAAFHRLTRSRRTRLLTFFFTSRRRPAAR